MNHVRSMAQPFDPWQFEGNTLNPHKFSAKKSGPSTALRAASSHTFRLEAVCQPCAEGPWGSKFIVAISSIFPHCQCIAWEENSCSDIKF